VSRLGFEGRPGHDTATVEAFPVLLAESAIQKDQLPIDSARLSLRLKTKSGIVAGRDAAAWVRIRD
jgi:hypothetical protein